jgi:two-component system, chemotaxis family, chemotaxis protein CheY
MLLIAPGSIPPRHPTSRSAIDLRLYIREGPRVPNYVVKMHPNASPELRVLIVEDDDMVRATLKRLLKAHGYLVEEADNASDALMMFQASRFDLVITDYDMAGMKGDALVAGIKAADATLPVVMITAHPESVPPSAVEKLNSLVAKPFSIKTLREAIDRALAGTPLPPSPPQV